MLTEKIPKKHKSFHISAFPKQSTTLTISSGLDDDKPRCLEALAVHNARAVLFVFGLFYKQDGDHKNERTEREREMGGKGGDS